MTTRYIASAWDQLSPQFQYSPEVSVNGGSVLVKGTVMDTSGGTTQDVITTRFADGLPAVSEDSMEAWMEYAYQQQIKPTNATGVDVIITVLDPNNNYYEVGTTTSDTNGFYSAVFTPQVPGKYIITVSFAGSSSYYPSHAVTAFAVDPSSPTPTPTAVPVESMADTYLLPSVAAIIVAIAVVGIVLALLVTKRRV